MRARRRAALSRPSAVSHHLMVLTNWSLSILLCDQSVQEADALLATARQHGLSLFEGLGAAYLSCAEGRTEDTHRALIALHERGTRCIFTSMCKSFLAAMEARAGHLDVALATIDDAIEETRHTDHRSHNAESYRTRGEILLKRDPANTAPAEEAFLTAEIEEAQKLLAALAATDELITATAARRQRVELQVAYANALISGRGHGAKETTAAFARARDLAANIEDPVERFPIYYGIWVGGLVRGELSVMRDIAEAAGRDAENNPGLREACTGWRIVGLTRSYEGDFVSRLSSFQKRQSVPSAMILFGLDVIIPASRSRSE